jgi:hypothetical protein
MAEDVVRARRFELVDDQGRARAALYMEAGQPHLMLADEDGNARAVVGINSLGNTVLRFMDAGGNYRVQMTETADETGLILSDAAGVHLSLVIGDDGHVIVAAAERGQNRAIGTVIPGGAVAFRLWDAEGDETHDFRQGP